MLTWVICSGNRGDNDTETQSTIRSVAMRDFRRRQREGWSAEFAQRKATGELSILSDSNRKLLPRPKRITSKKVQNLNASRKEPDSGSDANSSPDDLCTRQQRSTCLNFSSISNRKVDRVSAFSTFLDIFLPKRLCTEVTGPTWWLIHLMDNDVSTALLQNSIDAICFSRIGAKHGDQALQIRGSEHYSAALRLLRWELERPEKSRQHCSGSLLIVMRLAGVYERLNGRKGWRTHASGASKFLMAMGPHAVSERYNQMVFHSVRHFAINVGLACRVPIPFARCIWLDSTASLALTDPYVALYDIAVHLPAILQASDALPQSYDYAADLSEIARRVRHLQAQLAVWESIWQPVEPAYTAVNLTAFPNFHLVCGPGLFTKCYSFPYAQSCTLHQMYWLCSLLLDKTLLDVHSRTDNVSDLGESNTDLSFLTEHDVKSIEDNAFTTAIHLCRSMPYSTEPEPGEPIRCPVWLSFVLEPFFRKHGYVREAAWCKDVSTALEKMEAIFTANSDADSDFSLVAPFGFDDWVPSRSFMLEFRRNLASNGEILVEIPRGS